MTDPTAVRAALAALAAGVNREDPGVHREERPDNGATGSRRDASDVASGPSRAGPGATDRAPASVVEEAATAVADVRRAAVFVESTGTDRLRAAVGDAESRGPPGVARRGRRALAAVERFRAAAHPDRGDALHPGQGDAPNPDRGSTNHDRGDETNQDPRGPSSAGVRDDAAHDFHSGRTTTITGDSQGRDE